MFTACHLLGGKRPVVLLHLEGHMILPQEPLQPIQACHSGTSLPSSPAGRHAALSVFAQASVARHDTGSCEAAPARALPAGFLLHHYSLYHHEVTIQVACRDRWVTKARYPGGLAAGEDARHVAAWERLR